MHLYQRDWTRSRDIQYRSSPKLKFISIDVDRKQNCRSSNYAPDRRKLTRLTTVVGLGIAQFLSIATHGEATILLRQRLIPGRFASTFSCLDKYAVPFNLDALRAYLSQ